MKYRVFCTVITLLFVSTASFAVGILVPTEKGLPPLAVKYHRVNVDIRDQVAETSVEQVFHNSTPRQLEATFIFPLPEGASLTEFAMMMNGERVVGELVEKDEARKIYEEIVRSMRDPGLLEYIGTNLLKARVFPVPAGGDQKIEVKYSEVVPYDAGVVRYVYPLKTGNQASQTLEDFSMAVKVEASTEIKSVYSPSHEVGITKPEKTKAVIGFEMDKASLDRDFEMYFTVSEEEVGLNLLTFREKDKDGYFLLLIAPSAELEAEDVLPKDVTFVIDTSGSMREDDKIGQAKKALAHCLKSLSDKDRFNIVKFSTGIETFKPALTEAVPANVDEAVAFVEKMQSGGGTDIHGALLQALSGDRDKTRPHVVLFLTDGRPTVGQTTDKDAIVAAVKKQNADNARIFVFGVGSDVNTHLLDLVSGDNGGVSEYVKPRAEIEERVSAIYNKLSKPVLADVKLDLGKIETYDVFPKELGDIFAGTQLKVFGRYKGADHTAIKLAGKVRGGDRTYVYESRFEESNTDRKFIPRLWANRKVGYLLDEIRLHGENKELVDEVKTLSKEFGIMTPYTSFLVTEKDRRIALSSEGGTQPDTTVMMDGREARIVRGDGAGAVAEPRGRVVREGFIGKGAAETSVDSAPGASIGGDLRLSASGKAGETKSYDIKADSGEKAVMMSQSIRKMKESSETEAGYGYATRYVEGRVFYFDGEYWIEQDFRDAKDPKVVEIKYASDAYFRILAKEPNLSKVFSIAEKIVVKVGNVFVKVTDTGKDTLTDTEFEEIFK